LLVVEFIDNQSNLGKIQFSPPNYQGLHSGPPNYKIFEF